MYYYLDPEGVQAFKKNKDRNYATLKGSNKTASLNLLRVSLYKLRDAYNFTRVGDYSIRIQEKNSNSKPIRDFSPSLRR
jgi:hypothetical protein